MYFATRYVVGGIILNGYLLTIIGTVLLSSVLTALLPSGKTSSVIKGVTKLACVIAIVAPIPSFLQSNDAFDINGEKNNGQSVIQTDTSFIEYYCEMRVRNTETLLAAELEEEFSLQTAVDCEWRFQEEGVYDSDTVLITKITVTSQKTLSDEEKTAVWEYLTKNYCKEVWIA